MSLSVLLSLLLTVPSLPLSGFAAASPVESPSAVATDEKAEVEVLGQALAKLLNSGQEDPHWFLNHYAPSTIASMGEDRIVLILNMFRRDMVGAKLRGVRSLGEHSWSVSFYVAETNRGAVFELTIEEQSPHRILGLGARLVDGDPHIPGIVDGMSSKAMAMVIERYVGELAAADQFSGAVLLAKDGEVVFEKAWGLASRRYDVPNNLETRFNLGSMNKMFTAVALVQLQEAGKLNFHDKLIQHLPNFPNRALAEKVSLHHLLTHSSGMGNFWEAMAEVNWTLLRTPSDYLPLFGKDDLMFEPGMQFSYSNNGFVTLGLVIEAVSGMSYFDYVRDNIFEPLGMQSTDSFAMDEPVKNLAIGYTRSNPEGDGHGQDGPLRNNLYLHRVQGGPAGGGFSTARDLLRFANGLQFGDLLSPKGVETLLTGKVPTPWGPEVRYAYGFMAGAKEGHEKFGHSGGAPGINSVLSVYPADGYTVIVLSNCDTGGSVVGDAIEQMILRSDK